MEERIAALAERISREYAGSRLTRLRPAEVAALRDAYPGIPEEYLQLLAIVGWGRIGKLQFVLYSGPAAPQELWEDPVDEGTGLLLVGDDFSGHHAAYLRKEREWEFVELDLGDPGGVARGGSAGIIEYLEAWL